MNGVKSKKDRPAKNPKYNVPLSLEASAISPTLFILSICFEMYMSASRKQDFKYISYMLFPVNLNRFEMKWTVRKINPCKMYRTTKPAVLFDSIQAFSFDKRFTDLNSSERVGKILPRQLCCSQGLKEATLVFFQTKP